MLRSLIWLPVKLLILPLRFIDWIRFSIDRYKRNTPSLLRPKHRRDEPPPPKTTPDPLP